jgi:hypothetical protein
MPRPPAPRTFSIGHAPGLEPAESSTSDLSTERLLAGLLLGLCWGLIGLCFGWLSARRQSLQQNRLIELSLLVAGSHPDIARLCGRLAWAACSRSGTAARWPEGADPGSFTDAAVRSSTSSERTGVNQPGFREHELALAGAGAGQRAVLEPSGNG